MATPCYIRLHSSETQKVTILGNAMHETSLFERGHRCILHAARMRHPPRCLMQCEVAEVDLNNVVLHLMNGMPDGGKM